MEDKLQEGELTVVLDVGKQSNTEVINEHELVALGKQGIPDNHRVRQAELTREQQAYPASGDGATEDQ